MDGNVGRLVLLLAAPMDTCRNTVIDSVYERTRSKLSGAESLLRTKDYFGMWTQSNFKPDWELTIPYDQPLVWLSSPPSHSFFGATPIGFFFY